VVHDRTLRLTDLHAPGEETFTPKGWRKPMREKNERDKNESSLNENH